MKTITAFLPSKDHWAYDPDKDPKALFAKTEMSREETLQIFEAAEERFNNSAKILSEDKTFTVDYARDEEFTRYEALTFQILNCYRYCETGDVWISGSEFKLNVTEHFAFIRSAISEAFDELDAAKVALAEGTASTDSPESA